MNKILVLAAFLVLGVSCTIFDPIDEEASIGRVAPSVYWEQVDKGVSAGDAVKFQVQYFPLEGKTISELQVWYDITSQTSISASCPLLVSTASFTISRTVQDTVRQFNPVITYPHSESYYNSEKRTYFFEGSFPTTYTLAPIAWNNIETFDWDTYNKYFPASFQQSFKDSLYSVLTVDDFRKILTVTNPKIPEDEFETFIVCAMDSLQGRDTCSVLPQYVEKLKKDFYSIPYDSLFFDAGTGLFKLEYNKTYSLGAQFRVKDSEGVANFSEKKEVELR